ncbi:MAG: clan AA aspartic protease [Nitrospira sp.]|nr:clan AA aspartic protease [Nitrospira sp.]
MDQTGQWAFTDRTVQMSQCILLSKERLPISPLPVPAAIVPDLESIEASAKNRALPIDNSPLSSNHGISAPVRRMGQLYVVSVELNGSHTAQLILDTGASHTILSQKLVNELALMPSDYHPGLVQLKTASGSVDAQIVRIDSMKIASAEVRNSAAAVHTIPDFPAGVDGLLGLSFLHQFEITLDSNKGELRLTQVSP